MNVLRRAAVVTLWLMVTATGVAGRAEDSAAGRLRAVPRDGEEAADLPVVAPPGAADDPVPRQHAAALAELDGQWRGVAEPLILRAEAAGCERLAVEIRSWPGRASPPADGRQTIHRLPSTVISPDWLEGEAKLASIWADFLKARSSWADRVYATARQAAAEERGCEAVRLLAVTLLADPNHQRAREAGGWVRRVEDGSTIWLRPEAARRQSRREVYSPEFGWLPKTWLPRYAEGLRRQGTRWVPKNEVAAPRSLADAPIWQSDHWRISQLAGEACGLARRSPRRLVAGIRQLRNGTRRTPAAA